MAIHQKRNLKVSDIGEFNLINRLKSKIHTSNSVIEGIGDDTAIIKYTKDKYQLLTTDMLTEGVHFTLSIPAKWIGYKALACSVSDIAAMGGLPKYALVSVGAPQNTDIKFIEDIYAGMKKLTDKYDFDIVGGDTIKSEKVILNISLVGEVKQSSFITRSNANVGDQIFVTGKFGNSLKSGSHFRFIPRVEESQYLVQNVKPTSMIDCSDGLAQDLDHILKKSIVGANIYEDKLPKSAKATTKQALYDGEDFELIFTVKKDQVKKINMSKYKFTHIGEVVAKEDGFYLVLKDKTRKEIYTTGYNHFKS